MRGAECSAIQADAKEVGYVLVGAKRPGRRGPTLKMRSHCFRQYRARVRTGFDVPAAKFDAGAHSCWSAIFNGRNRAVNQSAYLYHE